MKTWVITGGVACGKSAVSKRLCEHLGDVAAHFSSDEAAHDLLEQPEIRAQLVQKLGGRVLDSEGLIDRGWLRKRMVLDRTARKHLEGVLHPGVFSALERLCERLRMDPRRKVLVAEVPLYYEVGSLPDADQVIVVASSQETQIERLRLHRGLAEAEAVALIETQLAMMDKVALSNRVIWNDGGIDALEDQVRLVAKDFWIS